MIFFAGCGKIERENRREWRGWRYELVKGEKLADYPVYWGKSIFSFTIIRTNLQSSSIDKETVANVVNIMKTNGITVAAETIPNQLPNLGPIDVSNNLTDYDALVSRVLGDDAVKEPDKPDYTSGSRRLWFEGDMILYHDSQPQEPIDGLNAKKRRTRRLRGCVHTALIWNGRATATQQPDGSYIVTVVQNIDQYALFDSYFYVRVAQDGIHEFTGSWFVVSGNQDMLANESARVKSIVSVLLDFARDEQRIANGSAEIVEINLGYMTKAKDTYHKNATAMPVWVVRCSDGRVYDYDAR